MVHGREPPSIKTDALAPAQTSWITTLVHSSTRTLTLPPFASTSDSFPAFALARLFIVYLTFRRGVVVLYISNSVTTGFGNKIYSSIVCFGMRVLDRVEGSLLAVLLSDSATSLRVLVRYHIPLTAFAPAVPLLMHDPPTYTAISVPTYTSFAIVCRVVVPTRLFFCSVGIRARHVAPRAHCGEG